MSTHSHDDVTRRSFTQQVGLFTGDDSPFARRFASPLSWISPLDAGMFVLDVACGAAHAAEQIAPLVRAVVGIDMTPALLQAGAERLRAAGIDNVVLQEGDATSLPFVDASFDIVICRNAVHHFPHPERALSEMARVCRPDGRVVVSDMIAPSTETQGAFDDLHRSIDPSHVHALLEAELADLVRDTVGPLTYGATSSVTLPLDTILTDAADRDRARSVLHAELMGGRGTGFAPARDGEQMHVTFTGTVVHATPGAVTTS